MELADFLVTNDVRMLNVAGNRASEIPTERLEEYRGAFKQAMVLLAAVAAGKGGSMA